MVDVRRAIGILLLTGLLLVLMWPLPALAGGLQSTGTAASEAALRADFNGDGAADLAIGARGENNFAGAVHVLYGSAGRLTAAGSQRWSQDSPGITDVAEPDDQFGSALAAGDFNGDARADLAIAAPGENLLAGVVHVLYGSAGGLTAAGSQLWSQDSPGVADVAEPDDEFGDALTTGDFNGDARADLAIGVPGENDFAGVAQVLYGSAGRLTAAGSQRWSQDSPGIASVAEPNDQFGFSLAAGDFNGDARADLAIAAPGEDGLAGVVQVLYGSVDGLAAAGDQLWSQDSPGVGDSAEADFFGEALTAGDFNDDSFVDLAVGVPFEDLGAIHFAGVVHVLYGSAGGLTAAGSQLWSQDSPGVADVAEPDDEFGDALTTGDFNGDGAADLAIGASGENNFAGVAQVLYGSAGGLTAAGSQRWSQNSPGIADVAEGSDGFGRALAAGDFNGDARADLAIGVPGENNFAGAVHVLYGSAGRLPAAGSQRWSQDSPGIADVAEDFDSFGESLAATAPQHR